MDAACERMTPARALALLQCTEPPVRGMHDQAQVDAVMEQWKRTTLRQAYRAQAKRWHPDLQPPQHQAQATRRMALVSEAYGYMRSLRVLVRAPRQQPGPRVTMRQGFAGGWEFNTSTSEPTATGWAWRRAS
jgi:hypothetical protein